MGKLHAIGNIQFRIYAGDHRPAHFHVHHPDYEVQIDIASLATMRGALPVRDRRTVFDWATLNQAALVAAWNDLNPDLAI